jgi:DNA-directed RNA polymerase subunit alpha
MDILAQYENNGTKIVLQGDLQKERFEVLVTLPDVPQPLVVLSAMRLPPAQQEFFEQAMLVIKKARLAQQTAFFAEPIEVLDLGLRTKNYLINEKIFTVGDIMKRSQIDLLMIPNLGRSSLKEITTALARFGLLLN